MSIDSALIKKSIYLLSYLNVFLDDMEVISLSLKIPSLTYKVAT